ncbi:50S ribosomal protein L25 [Lacticigenium naphthae]|uniref:50S ribosomal protein L25 n=1 Tax=Lacticigenium naphthae TaxID=515351 RepID=UPI0004014177|nr:50S ribosomal protein L25 [Lacticigenium naphthae]
MKIVAEKRTVTGTGASKRARNEGKVPATIFGKDVESLPVLINEKELEETLKEVGSNGVFDVAVKDGETYQVFVKDTARSSLKPILYNVDLLAFKKGEKVTMTIPVMVTGEDDIDEGYVSHSLSEVEVEVAPSEAPSEFILDVSKLVIGDTLSVSDLELTENMEMLTELDSIIVSVTPPPTYEEPEETDEEMAEPEIVGEEDSEEA